MRTRWARHTSTSIASAGECSVSFRGDGLSCPGLRRRRMGARVMEPFSPPLATIAPPNSSTYLLLWRQVQRGGADRERPLLLLWSRKEQWCVAASPCAKPGTPIYTHTPTHTHTHTLTHKRGPRRIVVAGGSMPGEPPPLQLHAPRVRHSPSMDTERMGPYIPIHKPPPNFQQRRTA